MAIHLLEARLYEETPRKESCVGILDSCSSLGAGRLNELGRNEFKIPEIIFNPTLDLSLHVCLLSMLAEYALSHTGFQEDLYSWTSAGLPGETLQPWRTGLQGTAGAETQGWNTG